MGWERIVAIIDAARPVEVPEIQAMKRHRKHSRPPAASTETTVEPPAGLTEKIRAIESEVYAAPPEERRSAFERSARFLGGLVDKSFTRADVVDHLQALAEAAGIVAAEGVDTVQAIVASAFANPIAVPESEAEPRPPEFSDDAIAARFAKEHSSVLHYVAVWNKWLRYGLGRWRPDDTLWVYDLARGICRSAAAECEKEKTALSIASAKTVAAVVSLARADRRIAATVDQWDSDPWSLNTPSGVIDLRTGEKRDHKATDYLTKITAVAPDASCPTPVWFWFLNRVCGEDLELIAFLQRMLGYGLTGSIRDHALFFLYGKGANGKSTFLSTATGCIGDYHRAAAIETFTASNTDRHPTDLAGLRGARIVTSVETEDGRRWAELKIKSLTGGDKIAARFMRQDFFEFTPTFKLLIAGNHVPTLRSVDEAMRRRFHLVPFTITVPAEERDEKLPEKLKPEWPGILAWMIQGCLDWQERGLDPPVAVRSATASYIEAEDALGAWVDRAGDRDPNAFETTTALFGAWKKHALRAGEWVGSERKFSQRLDERGDSLGLCKGRDSQGRRGFRGLRLPAVLDEPTAAHDDGDSVRL